MLRTLLIYGAARAVPALISLSFTLVCIQQLSSAQYGDFSLAYLPTMIAASFAGSLAGQPMLRFGASLSPKHRTIGLLRLPIIAALSTMPFLVGYLLWSGRPLTMLALAVGIALFVAVFDTQRFYLVASSQAMSILLLDSARSLISLAVLAILISTRQVSSSTPMAALLIATAASMLLILYKPSTASEHGNSTVDAMYIRYGIWVALWMVITGLFPFLERLLLERHFDLTVAGEYASIADPSSALMSAIGAILVNATMPRFVSAWNNHETASLSRLKVLSVLAVSAGVIACLGIGALVVAGGRGHIAIVLSEHSVVAVVLVTATGIWQMGIFFHKTLELSGATNLMFFALLASSLVFGTLSILLISPLGMLGIAMSKLVAGLFYIGLVNILGSKMWPHQ